MRIRLPKFFSKHKEMKKRIGPGDNRLPVYAQKQIEMQLRESFFKEMADIDIATAYRELVRGLDAESAQTVCTILSRIKYMENTEFLEVPLFSEEEEHQIKELNKRFRPNILQINEECFAYQHYLLPSKAIGTSVLYFQHEMRHLTTLDSIGDKAIIDVGAYIGDSALLFSHLFAGEIHSFEPIDKNYRLLLKTIELNKASRIIPVKLGLASSAREVTFHMHDDCSSESVPSWAKETETVNLITLDDYVAEHNLQVGLIKVDIEGAEQDFLKGAEKTIKNQKPILIISLYHNAYDFFQIKPLIESWNLGYTFKISRPSDGLILVETVLLAEVK